MTKRVFKKKNIKNQKRVTYALKSRFKQNGFFEA